MRKNKIRLAELPDRFVPIGRNGTFSEQIIYMVSQSNEFSYTRRRRV